MIVTDGEPANTEQSLRQAIARAPGSVQAHADLCALLCKRQRGEEAIALLDDVLARQTGALWALSLKAAVLDAERRTDEALVVHEALIARAPRAAIPWMNYGHALKTVGRLADAIGAYRRSLELDPGNGFAWYGLADLRTVRFGAEDVVSMERALARAGNDLNRVQLHFALGKALGDLGRFEPSFRHYAHANECRGRLIPHDAEAASGLVRRIQTALTSGGVAGGASRPELGSGAIFIVGMPRSGTTLVEQILASHPMIEGLGELPELREVAAGLDGMNAGPTALARLDGDALDTPGEQYLASTRRYRRTQRPFFTDKMPSNWQLIGLIRRILPAAKIIDVRRHPLACCLSIFTTYFSRQTQTPANLADLGRSYRDYVHAIDQVAEMWPGRTHRVRYEDLVDDLEGEVRRLLAHLGLPFDAGCLRFQDTPRAIHTPSAQQVRRPINRDGLALWRNYEPWLGPLKEELGAILET